MKRLPAPTTEFVVRLSLAGLVAAAAHQFQWVGLRMVIAQIILYLSRVLGMKAERPTSDAIAVGGYVIHVLVACTLVELMLGIQPLLWRRSSTILRNLTWVTLSIGALFGLNILRIEIALVLLCGGVPWILAHDIPLGAVYFAIWVAIWHTRKWRVLQGAPGQSATASVSHCESKLTAADACGTNQLQADQA